MGIPKAIKLVDAPEDFDGIPAEFAVVGGAPSGGGDVEVAWVDVTGKPSTFAPEAHDHEVADVTGLQDIIDGLTARIVALESA